jgi:hypothetical protein
VEGKSKTSVMTTLQDWLSVTKPLNTRDSFTNDDGFDGT